MNQNLVKLLSGYTDRYPHALEQKFSRVLDRIVDLWGTPALDAYFDDLMLVKEGAMREGFPPEVASEIWALSLAYSKWHEEMNAARSTGKSSNVWDHIPAKKRQAFDEKGLEFTPHGFEKAVEADNEGAIELYLSCGVDVDTADERGWTPLTLSSFNGHDHLAMLLMQHGARVGVKDKHGYTPLHWAAFRGNDNVVDLLTRQGADVNAASHSGWTPLMQAATRGHLISAAKLLAKGAFVNATTNDGWTALHKAAANGHTSVARLLLSKGADASIQHPNGSTALTLALKHKHRDIAKMLMPVHVRTQKPAVALHA